MTDITDRSVRTAIVGYGLAGSVFHAPLIAATDGLQLTTVVTRDDARAAAARRQYPEVIVLPTVDDLWRRRRDIDLVVVASPNDSHVPIGLAALDAGLPVLIDKPVAATAAAAGELRDAAAKKDLLVSVYHNRRWDGDFRTIQALLQQGALGAVHRFESRYERWVPQVDASAWRERADADVAGGLLFDLGSHLIDQALTLFGPVDGVYAEVGRVRAGAQVDDDVFLALTHPNGVHSHIWASAVAADAGPRLRVLGSAASYVKYGMDVQEDALRRGGTPRDAGWGLEPEAAWGRLGVPGDVRAIPTEPGGYQDYYAGIRDALRKGTPPPVTIDQAIEAMAVIEAARRSAHEGEMIRLAAADRHGRQRDADRC
jgi:predicted dehydrogenase